MAIQQPAGARPSTATLLAMANGQPVFVVGVMEKFKYDSQRKCETDIREGYDYTVLLPKQQMATTTIRVKGQAVPTISNDEVQQRLETLGTGIPVKVVNPEVFARKWGTSILYHVEAENIECADIPHEGKK